RVRLASGAHRRRVDPGVTNLGRHNGRQTNHQRGDGEYKLDKAYSMRAHGNSLRGDRRPSNPKLGVVPNEGTDGKTEYTFGVVAWMWRERLATLSAVRLT